MIRYILPIVFVCMASLSAQSAVKSNPCEAPAEIKDAIAKAGAGGIGSLLEQHPDDFWIRRAYIDSAAGMGSGTPRLVSTGIPNSRISEAVISRFQKDYASRPEDPEAAYLYAYSLIHRDTAKSVEILNSIIRRTPAFPPALLTLAVVHGYPSWYDQSKVRSYAGSYLGQCPDSIEPRIASLASQLERPDLQIAYAKSLRDRIAGKADQELIPLYPNLWMLESRLALPDAQAESKKHIEKDLQFLEGLDKTKFPQRDAILTLGYDRTGNREATNRLAKGSSPTGALSSLSQISALAKAQSDWARSNAPPAAAATREERTDYYKKQLRFLDELREQMPQNPNLLMQRFLALDSLPDTTDETLVREGGQLLAALRSQGSVGSARTFDVLRIWAKRGLELNLIPSLVQEVVQHQSPAFAKPSVQQQSDLDGGSYQTLMNEHSKWTTNTNAWSILVTAHAKKRQFEQARGILTEWETALNERRKKAEDVNAGMTERLRTASPAERSGILSSPIANAESTLVSGIPSDESRFYDGRARLAAAEGHMLDALTFYQSSLRLMYGRYATLPNFAELDAGKEADAIWKKLGGSEAGWAAWLDSIRTMPSPNPVPQRSGANRAIPAFTMTDQNGKTWTLDSLKGKITLINVWATWCAPCRRELPLLQQLYEQVKDRKDIQVITLNIDEDKSLVEPFLKTNKMSFPSLFAGGFVREFAGALGIPTTWIADATGTIRSEALGFSGDGAEWVTKTLKQMEGIQLAAK